MTLKRQKGTAAFLAACLFPAVLLTIVFVIYPTLSIFYVSLFRFSGYSDKKVFVGLKNYETLLSDTRFAESIKNSLLLIIIVTAFTLVLALWCANVLMRERVLGKGFFRVVFYIPNILSSVVIAAVFSAVYDPSRGLLNGLLSVFGSSAPPVMWLGDRSIVIYCIAAVMIWQGTGYYMVMYTASMSQIPESLYEAASIEGAGRARTFFSITLPQIMGSIRTTLTFFIISNINLSFLLVRAMTGGGPDGASEVMLSYMYKQAYTNSSYGYGMAIGVFVFIISFALAGIANLATRQRD